MVELLDLVFRVKREEGRRRGCERGECTSIVCLPSVTLV